jgi:prolyl oligopeptidase
MKLVTLTFASVVTASVFACGGETLPPPAPPAPTPTAPPSPVATTPPPPAKALPYPATRTGDAKDVLFGTTVPDPYRWLEDVKSDDVKKWMDEEDALARAELAKRPGRDAMAARLKELFYVDSVGIPVHRGARYFWSKRDATKEKSIVYYKDAKAGAEKILLDPNAWSAGGTNVSLGGWWPTWDGKTVAYKIKSNNSDEATMYLMDVATGKKSEIDVIEGAKYAGASWTPKGDGFYYTWLPVDKDIPTAERPGYAEIRFHKVGADPKKDARIYEATHDAKTFLSASLSKDGAYLFVYVTHGWSRGDVYFKDLRAKEDAGFKPLVTGTDALFDVDAFQGRFYVKTNDGAPKYKVFVVDPKKTERSAWKELVPERADATLDGTAIIGGKLVLDYLKDVATKLEVHELDGKLVREVTLPAIGTAGISGREDEDEAYVSFTSLTFPTEIQETSVKTGQNKPWFKLKVPVDSSKYEVEQLFFKSKDGTKIPLFLVRAKDAKKDGKSPLLINGYGGFQSSQLATFRASIFPWLEKGGIFALVNLRGGAEYGEEWHRAGMKRSKQNVFDDFEGAAEFLQKEGWSTPGRTAITGGSNGGLLVGAAATQRPDLYRVVLCDVPLLDMVRYHKFGSGKTWVEEYGSSEDEADFKAIFAYSPYHHVVKGTKYPSILMLSADSDDRVDPLHARKFTAAMQDASTGGPVILRIEKNAGHGGADMVKAWVEKLADEYAFALSEMDK